MKFHFNFFNFKSVKSKSLEKYRRFFKSLYNFIILRIYIYRFIVPKINNHFVDATFINFFSRLAN